MNRKMWIVPTVLLGITLLLAAGVRYVGAGDVKEDVPAASVYAATSGAAGQATEQSKASSYQPEAAVGSAFTYQGQLKANDSPASGTFDLQFSLFDAVSGGSQVGSTQTFLSMTVTDGLFTVSLDFGASAFQGEGRWLQIAVRPAGGGSYTTLSPRQALTATPYALSLRPGAVITGTSGIMLSALNYGNGNGLYGASTGGSGVYGESISSIGVHGASNSFGVFGESIGGYGVAGESYAGTNGRGVSGISNCATCYGVYGLNNSGTGVYGESTGSHGVSGLASGVDRYGVYGRATADYGKGVYGYSDRDTGVYGYSQGMFGVQGTSVVTNGVGVWGHANTGTTARGVVGSSTNGTGVNGSGGTHGVSGISSGGTGVYGTSTNGYGVFGSSSNYVGGYFTSDSADAVKGVVTNTYSGIAGVNNGSGYGVFGSSASGDGVQGRVNNTSSGVAAINLGSGNGLYGFSAAGTGGYFPGGPYGVRARSSYTDGVGVWGYADAGANARGVIGSSASGTGVYGTSLATNGLGVIGEANNGGDAAGVYGTSLNGAGVWGVTASAFEAGVLGHANGGANSKGVHGYSDFGYGVYGNSLSGYGVYGGGSAAGVFGNGGASGVVGTGTSYGVQGSSSTTNGIGVFGNSTAGANGLGVFGTSNCATCRGVNGTSTSGYGVAGSSTSTGTGVHGSGSSGNGVYGTSTSNDGVVGTTTAVGRSGVTGLHDTPNQGNGVYGRAPTGAGCPGANCYAGFFSGNAHVTGTLSKGGGAFKIDHPLDPENKYLYHSFVESPDMMNIYNGNVTTDEKGEAVVVLPDWFEALNNDFRYQLTPIGQFAQAIVASKVKENRFTIRTDKPFVEVSWQVTGIRHDPYANAHRIPVEEEKSKEERGRYLHPTEWGQLQALSVEREERTQGGQDR